MHVECGKDTARALVVPARSEIKALSKHYYGGAVLYTRGQNFYHFVGVPGL